MNIIKNKRGFTLIELIIVIVIVGILSVVSVPIYRKYITEAIMTEGYTLVGAIARAELIYHTRPGSFLKYFNAYDQNGDISYESYLLGIYGTSGNKYFCDFHVGDGYSIEQDNDGLWQCIYQPDSIGIWAYGCAGGLEEPNWDYVTVGTVVHSNGKIEDFQEDFYDPALDW